MSEEEAPPSPPNEPSAAEEEAAAEEEVIQIGPNPEEDPPNPEESNDPEIATEEEQEPETAANDEDHISCSLPSPEAPLMIMDATPAFGKEEIDSAYRDFMRTGKMPYGQLIPPVMQEISRQKLAALQSKDYDSAKAHDNAMSLMHQQLEAASLSEVDAMRKQVIQSREEQLKQELRDTRAKWKVKLEKHSDNSEFRIRQLRERHDREIQEFRQKYKDPAFLHKFNRPSRELLTMRRAEKKLAMAKKYADADRTKAQADRLQAFEEAQMQQAIQQQVQSEFAKLRENQKMEIDRLIVFDQQTRAKLEAQRLKEIEPIEASLQGLEVRKNEAVNKKLLAMQFVVHSPYGSKESGGRSESLPTPRTQAKLVKFRNQKVVEMSIKPVADSTFDRLEEINRKRSKLPKLKPATRKPSMAF